VLLVLATAVLLIAFALGYATAEYLAALVPFFVGVVVLVVHLQSPPPAVPDEIDVLPVLGVVLAAFATAAVAGGVALRRGRRAQAP
jgi:hypothetical protein